MSDIAVDTPASATTIDTELNYLEFAGEKPVSYQYEPPPGVPKRSGVYRAYRVPISNARVAPPPGALSLDRNGFELHRQPSALRDFSDPQQIKSVYYAEAESLLKRATGAQRVVVFDHTLRDGKPERSDGVREPVKYIHNDQTFVSGPRRVRDHLPKGEAEQLLQGRVAIVNLWRPIGDTVQSSPLAVCDSRSIALNDLVASDLVYPDKVGETYALVFNPRHRWYYFPRMTPDEYLLLKIYDSAGDSIARLSAHTAFDDPTSAPNAPARRSIELRSLLFF